MSDNEETIRLIKDELSHVRNSLHRICCWIEDLNLGD